MAGLVDSNFPNGLRPNCYIPFEGDGPGALIRFIMMLRANPDRAGLMVKRLRTLKSDRRVRILEKYTVFGKYDAALILDCADSAEATEFALRVASEAHCTTETFMATPIREIDAGSGRD